MVVYLLGKIENAGMDCLSRCNQTQGPCKWCGSMGFCCTKYKRYPHSNGCDGTFGEDYFHACALKPIGIFIDFLM